MLMPGRKYSSGKYRYGFNGKENDNEVKGDGNQQDYGMRVYDQRVSRFLSVDPLSFDYPSWSPFPFAMNRPIDGIDLDGKEHEHYTISWKDRTAPPVVLSHKIGPAETQLFGFLWDVKVDHVVFVDYPSSTFGNRSFTLRGPDIVIFQEWLANPSSFRNLNGSPKDIGQILESDAARELRAINYSLMTGAEMFQFAPLRNNSNSPENVIKKQASSANNKNTATPESKKSTSTFEYEGQTYDLMATVPYKRPTNATNAAQRKAVNLSNASCATCGTTEGPFSADHKTPLAVEHLSTGGIDKGRMRSTNAVQPQCKDCSNKQGGQLRQVSKKANEQIKVKQHGQTGG